jgi:membrane protease YdiL (CAAX protease family)
MNYTESEYRFTLYDEEPMNKKKIVQFGMIIFVGFFIWTPLASRLISLLLPEASSLLSYLLNKGLFVVVILATMNKASSLKFFGIERGSSWWFLLPGLPILLLTAVVLFDPNAAFGLSMPAALGWVVVALFVGIGEETVFRGILWRAFEARGVMTTALATSALFGLVHLVGLFSDFPWQIITSQAVFAFGVGMMFAAVRLVSGSLLAPIALHAVFDAGALVAAGGVRELFNDTMSVERLIIPGALFAVWGAISILIVQKRRARDNCLTGLTQR